MLRPAMPSSSPGSKCQTRLKIVLQLHHRHSLPSSSAHGPACSPAPCAPPLRPSDVPSSPRYKLRKLHCRHSALHGLSPGCLLFRRSTLLMPRPSPRLRPDHRPPRTVRAGELASAPPKDGYLPPCIAIVLPDSRDQEAHTRLQPSARRAARSPFPGPAPRILQPALPALLPAFAGNEPPGSHADSVLYMSVHLLRSSPPRPAVS